MYTTTDIGKCLGIKRERLKVWLDHGYITSSQSASGRGSKNLFSKFDLYLLKLFTSLVERGFPREEAARQIKLMRGSLYANEGEHIELIGFVRKDGNDKKPGFPEIFFAENAKDFADGAENIIGEFLNHNCDDILVINFKKIRMQVNSSLPD